MARVYIELVYLGAGLQSAALADIQDITENRVSKENKENLVIPSNSQLPVELSPGKYIIRAKLPSGKLLKQKFDVSDTPYGTHVLVRLDSPHEWLGMQTLMGSIQQDRDVYSKRLIQAEAVRRRFPIDSTVSRTWILSSKTPSWLFHDSRERPSLESTQTSIERGYFFALPESSIAGITTDSHDLSPDISDSITQLFELNLDKLFAKGLLSNNYRSLFSYHESNTDFERTYLFTRAGTGSLQYSVVPIPWPLANGGEASIEIAINTESSEQRNHKNYDALHRISVVVRDPLFGAMIGYLSKGDLAAASTILESENYDMRTAKEMLYYKMMNPLAAAAGAYIMLGSQPDLSQRQEWYAWIGNLRKWFQWLPDGAIQYAWLQLAQLERLDSTERLKEIRKYLLEAYFRGCPYYSRGVKMLLDGLTIFSENVKTRGETDKEIDDAVKNVRRLALRVNPTQPFTSVIMG